MIALIATLKVADGKAAEFEAFFTAHAAKVRANEAGNHLYQLVKSRTEDNTYKVLELYADQAAIEAHRAADYQQAMGPVLAGMLDGPIAAELLDAV